MLPTPRTTELQWPKLWKLPELELEINGSAPQVFEICEETIVQGNWTPGDFATALAARAARAVQYALFRAGQAEQPAFRGNIKNESCLDAITEGQVIRLVGPPKMELVHVVPQRVRCTVRLSAADS